MRDKIRMIGYNASRSVVCTDCLESGDFYDGDHVWDRGASVLELGLVKVIGEKYDGDGKVVQTWKTVFSQETGVCVGDLCIHADGTVNRTGILQAAES